MAGGGGGLSEGRAVSRAATAGRNLWNPSPRGGSAGTRRPIIKGSPHTLGGEQVEGRQAVRELLAARRRQVTEVWMTEGSDPSPILGEIDRLAREAHVPVRLVSARRLESVQGTDAPQGVVAFAEPLTAVSLDELVLGWKEESAAATSDAGPDAELEIDDDEDDAYFLEIDDAEDMADSDDEFPLRIRFVDDTEEPAYEDADAEIEPVIASDNDVAGQPEPARASATSAPSVAETTEVATEGGGEADKDATETEDTGDVEADVSFAAASASAVKKALKASTAAAGAPPENAFLVLLEGITDPQNLGAILRSAECAGVTGVAVPRHRSVHVTPAVTKAAAGAIEYLQMALLPGVPSALQDLERLGVMTVGLDERGTTSLYDLDVGDRPVALVLGSEGSGLSPLSRRRCEVLCRIPVSGEIPSLNVSAAAAVACFEVARQRSRGARRRR